MLIIAVLIALAVGAGGGVLVYVYLVGGTGEATRSVQAATLEPNPETGDDQTQTFTIVPEESEILFLLDEDLMGRRNTVIGRTDQVTGNILVDFDNPSASMVGPIEINLRTLSTDNEFRNRAMRDQILESNRDEFEFTTFTPTAISGLPEAVEVGDTFTFTLTGDLPIRTTTTSVDWDVEVTVVSETRIEGRATTTITRAEYGLVIPTVPTVANVEEEVDLAIEFVAVAEE
jgi:polyisoprenoid-binding protein YceI